LRPPNGFESAGDDFNPDDHEHLLLAEGGPHAGDIANRYVPESGPLRGQVINSAVSLDGGAAIRGKALPFHEAADDYATQPSGEGGGRLACGVIE
jgi:Cu-Zn family superoxide dismutase